MKFPRAVMFRSGPELTSSPCQVLQKHLPFLLLSHALYAPIHVCSEWRRTSTHQSKRRKHRRTSISVPGAEQYCRRSQALFGTRIHKGLLLLGQTCSSSAVRGKAVHSISCKQPNVASAWDVWGRLVTKLTVKFHSPSKQELSV